MKVDNIKGTRDYIDVYIGDKVVRITGELIVGGFVADEFGITEWKDGSPISEKEKEEIMNAVREKTKGSHMVITFE